MGPPLAAIQPDEAAWPRGAPRKSSLSPARRVAEQVPVPGEQQTHQPETATTWESADATHHRAATMNTRWAVLSGAGPISLIPAAELDLPPAEAPVTNPDPATASPARAPMIASVMVVVAGGRLVAIAPELPAIAHSTQTSPPVQRTPLVGAVEVAEASPAIGRWTQTIPLLGGAAHSTTARTAEAWRAIGRWT